MKLDNILCTAGEHRAFWPYFTCKLNFGGIFATVGRHKIPLLRIFLQISLTSAHSDFIFIFVFGFWKGSSEAKPSGPLTQVRVAASFCFASLSQLAKQVIQLRWILFRLRKTSTNLPEQKARRAFCSQRCCEYCVFAAPLRIRSIRRWAKRSLGALLPEGAKHPCFDREAIGLRRSRRFPKGTARRRRNIPKE